MGDDNLEEMDMEVLTSMWPEDLEKEAERKFHIEKPGNGMDQEMLEEVTSVEDSFKADFKRLQELTNYSEKGSNQLGYLVKNWEYKQANDVRLLNEELDILSKQNEEVELKKLEIQEEHPFEEGKYASDKRAMQLEKLLEASIQREQALIEKLQENIKLLERQSSPVEELSHILKRADNFLHFVLHNAPVIIGHQDKDLRYRFIYNHFPSLGEEHIIGKTDMEIFSGSGVKESHDFKKEVLERGLPAKRELTFETELFGTKTFLYYVEPVFSKAGDTIGVNYMAMDITDQVIKKRKKWQSFERR